MAPWLYAVLERQNALAVFPLQGGRIAAQPAHTVACCSGRTASTARNWPARWKCIRAADARTP
ncbi:hypothetical protein [Paracidovorax cattleyae]|uniref:hypothetical protein n=1 Tax=Paracidovorax cattleyae TaxID=80868 RepID=UPI001428D458|nr:hypothetical protein [Paracidovorax cattleyae]